MLVLPMLMVKKKFIVSGMHCKSCEMLVMDELLEIEGVENVKASFQDGIITLDSRVNTEDSILKKVIEGCGFEVE